MSDTGHSGQQRRRTVAVDGERLRDLRFRRGWTQQELSVAAGLSLRTIEHAEAGRRVSLQTITLIAKALSERVESLIGAGDNLQDQGFSIHQGTEQPTTSSETQRGHSVNVQIVLNQDIKSMNNENVKALLELINQTLGIQGEVKIIKIERG